MFPAINAVAGGRLSSVSVPTGFDVSLGPVSWFSYVPTLVCTGGIAMYCTGLL